MNPIFASEYLILLAIAIVLMGAWMSWHAAARCRRPYRIAITVCRSVALTGLAIVALNPGTWRVEKEQGDEEWAILVDRSRSMAVEDVGKRSRWAAARDASRRIASTANDTATGGRTFLFAEDLTNDAADGEADHADGSSSRITRAGQTLLARYRSGNKRLAGIILISDGRECGETSREQLGVRARAQECPVYPIVMGGIIKTKDLAVRAVRREHVAFVGQKLNVGIRLTNSQMGRATVTAVLSDAHGKKLDEQRVAVDNNAEAVFSFTLDQKVAGYQRYVVSVRERPGESTPVNNTATFGVVVLDSKLRIFMAEGTPSWDSKFMAQLLRNQPNIEMCNVYRVSANRFLRINNDASKVTDTTDSVFPDSIDKLAAYDLVVFGKGAEYFLNPSRIKLLRQFVRDRGGSLLFSRGKPYSGEFPELEPLEPVIWGRRAQGAFRFAPTDAGEQIGLFGRMLPAQADRVWARLPELQFAHRCKQVKGFSQVLAQGRSANAATTGGIPLIISQRFGKGIVLTVNAEDFWHWDFFPSVSEADGVYKELWTQLIQWAATYAEYLPGQEFSLKLNTNAALPNEPLQARIGRRYAGNGSPPPVLRIKSNRVEVQKRQISGEPGPFGGWDLVFSLPRPGLYLAELADHETGKALGPCVGIHIISPPTEKSNLSSDPNNLRKIAEYSGGKLLTVTEACALVRSYAPQNASVDLSKALWHPAWDTWYLLLLILACFGTECFLRRRNGLL